MFIIKTDLQPSEALQHIQSVMNAQNKGWTLTHKDNTSITFTRTGKPNILATILLLFLWVLPGILYLIFAWRKETANFFIGEREDSTAITVEAGMQTPVYGKLLAKRLCKVTEHVVTENRESIWRSQSLNAPILAVIVGLLLVVVFIIF